LDIAYFSLSVKTFYNFTSPVHLLSINSYHEFSYTSLVLDDESSDLSMPMLLESLAMNSTVGSVRIDGYVWSKMEGEDQAALLDLLGKLPSLQEFHFVHGVFSVAHLSELLRATGEHQLKVMHLESIQLDGESSHFTDLNFNLRMHPTLTVFEALDFEVTNQGEVFDLEIDSIVKMLSTIPNLRVIRLYPRHEKSIFFSGSTIMTLSRLFKCEDMMLKNMPFKALHFKMIAFLMKKIPLRSLCLSQTSMDDESAQLIAAALADCTSLESLDVSGNQLGDVACAALAKALIVNAKTSHLEKIDISGNKSISSKGLHALGDMLNVNHTLTTIQLPTGCNPEEKVIIAEHLLVNRKSNGKAATAA
jgi:hypothetical protein